MEENNIDLEELGDTYYPSHMDTSQYSIEQTRSEIYSRYESEIKSAPPQEFDNIVNHVAQEMVDTSGEMIDFESAYSYILARLSES